MKYTEIKGNLFDVESNYVLAHCISVDCKMGAGIAVQFDKQNPKMRNHLLLKRPQIGDALFYNGEGSHRVFNLITKEKYWHKPTRDDFEKSLVSLKNEMINKDFFHLAIPLIGAGLDRLNWEKSKDFIMREFADTDIEVAVYKL